MLNKLLKNIYITGLFLAIAMSVFAQSSTCDTTLINAHVHPAGFQRLYVQNQPCSMYFYDPTPMYGIDAHRAAANLGIPQVVIDDAQENTNVLNALYSQNIFPNNNYQAWMGITDSASIFTWRTFTGAPLPSYTNWTAGEPNNMAPSCRFLGSCLPCTGANAYFCANGEDCAVISSAGTWLDITCEGSNITRIAILELNTCPVITRPRDTAICSGNPVALSTAVVTGGTAPYTYTWSPGGQSGQTITISPSTTATYTVEASDNYHCRVDSSITITVSTSTPPTINLSQSTACTGDNITASLNSISATATYSWSFGAGSAIVSGTGGGPYQANWSTPGTKTITVSVSDHGCITTATATVNISSASAAFSLNPTTNACAGQNIVVTASTVSPTAIYTWSFGSANVVSGSGAGPYSINWSSAGAQTVSLTVTDNGCTASTTANTIILNGLSPSFTLFPSLTACPGQTVAVTLSGTVSPTATYTWSFGGGTVQSGTGGGPYSVSWNNTGTQTIDLTVTDGCTGSATESINIHNTLSANAGPDIQLCPGVSGTIGTAPVAGYSYSWSPATGLSSNTVADPTIVIGSNISSSPVTSQYIVNVSSGSCSAADTVNVTIYPDINNSFTVNPSSVCVGSKVTVAYTGSPSPTANYTWGFGGANIVSGTGVGPYVLNWVNAGAQIISLSTSDYGCTATPVSSTVSVGAPVTANAGSNQTVCSGVSVQLGTTPVSGVNYTWSPATDLSSTLIANPIFQQTNNTLASTTNPYMLIADAGGCPDTAYVAIVVSPAANITITASSALSFCQGDSVILQENAPQMASYLWSTAATTSSITAYTSGTYSVTAYDANGCQHISNPPATVAVFATPIVSLSAGGQHNESCWGSNDASLTVHGMNGSPTYSYLWSTTPPQTGASATGLSPGRYTVTVTDANTCSSTASFTATAATYLGLDIYNIRDVSCFGKSDGAAFASGTGGTRPYYFLWSSGSTADSAGHLHADSVSVVMTDSNGCQVDTTVYISQPAPITITSPPAVTIDFGSSQTLNVTVSPPSLSYTYSWFPASTLNCRVFPDPKASPTYSTLYTLTVTDTSSGCYDTASVQVLVNPINNLYIPNAFSPNGDGVNDIYNVYTYGGVKFYELMIWDRWGEMVYKTNDTGEGWDGTYKGTKVEAGEYVYHVTVAFLDGQTIYNKGSVTVIR